jgi:uncharacterized protein
MKAGMRAELEAATFRQLVEHLRERSDVQNIDLMELAGFCRTAWRTGIKRLPPQRACHSARKSRERSSMACPMRHGRRGSRRDPPSRTSIRAESLSRSLFRHP